MSHIDTGKIAQRAFRVLGDDGLAELAAGTYLVLVGALMLTPARAIAIILAPVLLAGAVAKLKQHYTYTRVGYARLPDGPPGALLKGMALWLAGCAVVVLAGLAVVSRGGLTVELWKQWTPLWLGLCLTGGFIWSASRGGTAWPLIYAAVSVCAGVLSSLLPAADYMARLQSFALVLGTTLIVGGLATFLVFLRRHPVSEGGESAEAQ